MTKILIFGNSGSGKSTLAKSMSLANSLAHLDLDTIAWEPVHPPVRKSLDAAGALIQDFIAINDSWVIEGCYADLLELVTVSANQVIFLNLSIQDCIANAKNRPWEPHKYPSKQAQDSNLEMLIEWISQYDMRQDSFSRAAHEALFDQFIGQKVMHRTNQSLPAIL